MTEYHRPETLVSTEWLAEHLDDSRVRVVEVDEDTQAYHQGHIRGAVALHWQDELQDPVRRDFLDQSGFERLIRAKGISSGDTVVLYGGNNNWFAAYAYWYFKIYGHADVRLLNGGRRKWELEGRELTSEVREVRAGDFSARPADSSIRAFRDEVVGGLGTASLVDVRSPDEFSGKLAAPAHLPQEAAQRRGHIPTAVNVPWSKATNEDGTFRSEAELRELYVNQQGLDPERETIAYCRIGERSSHTWFVLRELLGFRQVKNYDGSWTEYGSLVGVPIETAAASEPQLVGSR